MYLEGKYHLTQFRHFNISRLGGANLHTDIEEEPPRHRIEFPHLRDGGLAEAQGELFQVVLPYRPRMAGVK